MYIKPSNATSLWTRCSMDRRPSCIGTVTSDPTNYNNLKREKQSLRTYFIISFFRFYTMGCSLLLTGLKAVVSPIVTGT